MRFQISLTLFSLLLIVVVGVFLIPTKPYIPSQKTLDSYEIGRAKATLEILQRDLNSTLNHMPIGSTLDPDRIRSASTTPDLIWCFDVVIGATQTNRGWEMEGIALDSNKSKIVLPANTTEDDFRQGY